MGRRRCGTGLTPPGDSDRAGWDTYGTGRGRGADRHHDRGRVPRVTRIFANYCDPCTWFDKRPGTDAIVERELPNGPTLLFHDAGSDRSQTVEALRQLKQQGYAFGFPVR